jgi:MFS family permease
MLAALLAVFIGAIDLSIIATILPSIISDLNVNTADIDRYIWVVNAYLIAYIAAIPLAGRLSDLLGRRTIFLACLALFLVGSIVCATAQTLDSLILARAIQGLGGGGLLPVTMALAGDLLPRRSHVAAIGAIASVETFGWIVGPIYGAAIAQLGNSNAEAWRWVFWLNIPIVLLAGWAIRRRIPGPPLASSLGRLRSLDVPGAIFLTGAIVFACLGLTSSGEVAGNDQQGLRAFGGTPNPLADRLWLLLIVATLFVVLFVFRARTAVHPILPTSLFRHPGYTLAIIGNFLLGSVMMIGVVNVPVVVALLVSSADVSWTSAALLAPYTIAIAGVSLLGGWVEQRFSQRTVLVSGSMLAGIGFALLYPLLDPLDVWLMVPGLLIAGAGIGLLIAPLGSISLQSTGSDERGAATSTLMVARLLGMTIGISGLSAIGVHRLQVLTGRLDPIVRRGDEGTAAFLARQQQFITDHAIPLAVQVIQEVFVIAAIIAVAGIVPLLIMNRQIGNAGDPEPRNTLRE